MRKPLVVVAVCVGVMAAQTRGDMNILSFTYDNLATHFDSSTMAFSVTADIRSSGRVARVVAPIETAEFDVGDAIGHFSMDLTVAQAGSDPDIFTGLGDFLITDDDGDTISGEVAGTWERLFTSFVEFSGTIQDVWLNENQDGMFDGTTRGAFDMDLDAYALEPYAGGILGLTLVGGNWFDGGDFDQHASVLATVSVIPLPGAAVLGALGLATLSVKRGRRG